MNAQGNPGGDGTQGLQTGTGTVKSPPQPMAEPGADECKEFREPQPVGGNAYGPAFRMVLPIVPLCVAVGAALMYASIHSQWIALLGGGSALALMGGIAYLMRPSTGARTASPRSYGPLYAELLMVDSRLGICEHDQVVPYTPIRTEACKEPSIAEVQAMACSEAFMYRNAFVKALQSPASDTRWVQGVGYVELWTDIHHAEEALLLFEPREMVQQDGEYDRNRLRGALMDQGPDLSKTIDAALQALDPFNDPQHPLPQTPDEMKARRQLREVRAAINGFRDDSRDGIVRARRRLLEVVLALGIFTCVLESLAILLKLDTLAFTDAFWVYLIGVGVGLFNRLYLDSRADTQVDDFGLGNARLIAMPLFSGLAAVGGVVLTSLVSHAALLSHDVPITFSQLSKVFNLQDNPANIAVAAVFGLTPALLVNTLQQQATNYLSNIKSSNATTPISR